MFAFAAIPYYRCVGYETSDVITKKRNWLDTAKVDKLIILMENLSWLVTYATATSLTDY